MSGYLIAQLNVTNIEPYKKYIEETTPIVKKYGGEFIIRGGKFKVVWGEWKYTRNVIIKFPNIQKTYDWYNSSEYQPIKKMREDNSNGNAIIIEG